MSIVKGEFPYGHFIKLIGGKWKPYILIAIDFEGSIRFNSIIKKWKEVSPKMLYQHLRALEEDGLIYRQEVPDVRQHVEYFLTDSGKKIIPIIKEMYKFAINDMIEKDILIDSRAFDYYNPSRRESDQNPIAQKEVK